MSSTLPAFAAHPGFDVVEPSEATLDKLVSAPLLAPFSPEALRFLNDVSISLLRPTIARRFPELAALGFWMRPGALKRLAERYAPPGDPPRSVLAARGVAFHIAPSNVDTIFVYSWLASLLAGNSNVVRLSRKLTPQVDAMLAVLNELFLKEEHLAVRAKTLLVRYEPNPATTGYFSSHCDVRVIWGGDATVSEVRQVPIPPLSSELVFGDRFSTAIVRATAWNKATSSQQTEAVHGFVNDTYWFMQMACSSPRMVNWIGTHEEIEAARGTFWEHARAEIARRKLEFSDRDYISKRVAAASMAVENAVRIEAEPNGDLTRLWIDQPNLGHRDLHCGAGLFWESGCESLEALGSAFDRRVQTVAHFGFSRAELVEFIRQCRPRGGDRWVPFGHALDFDHIWDGHDLIASFSREVTIAD